jgi:hypothetical protein
MKIFWLLLLVSFSGFLWGQKAVLLPTPQYFTINHTYFPIGEVTIKVYPSDSVTLKMVTGFLSSLSMSLSRRETGYDVIIHKVPDIKQARVNKNEAYRLHVVNRHIIIEAIDDEGVFRALQTIRQLIIQKGTKRLIEGCDLTDWPAFRIRGFMQDVGRGFISVSELKKELALLSYYKINVFQWHLTEDIAWRLEMKQYPELTDSASMTALKGDFYTPSDVRDLLAFCKEHYITVIPEIDMPGHSDAFTRAFHCNMQSAEGMKILKPILKNVCSLFSDVPYIHIGTDEVKFQNPVFVPSMVTYLHSLGKKVITWDPGWHFKTGGIDMVQLWANGVPPKGVPAIDSRYYYLNHFDPFADLSSVFFCKILGHYIGNDSLAGAIASVWNDRIITPTRKLLWANSFYPVMLTLAERSWKGGGMASYAQIGTRMPPKGSVWYRHFVNFENRLLYQKHHTLRGEPFPYVRQSNIVWNITYPFPNGGNLMEKFPPEFKLQRTYWFRGKKYNTKEAIGATVYLRHTWGPTISPAFYKDPKPDFTAYAYTWVYSPIQQNVGALIEFQDYSRSEHDALPPQGAWDFKGSKVWVNGESILPPVWYHGGTPSLMNENSFSRPPIQISLKKGWNKILLKLPVGSFSTPQVRLVKWMFSFVFVTLGGNDAIRSIIYSPDKSK